MFQHTRRTVRPDRALLALVGGVLVALAMWTLVADRGQTLETLSPTVALVMYALVLGAAAAVYVLWRLACIDGADTWNLRLSGWLVVGLTVAGLPGFLLACLQQMPRQVEVPVVDGWLLVSQVAVTAVLVMITGVSERFDVVGDPAFVGVVGSLALTAVTCLAMTTWPSPALGPAAATLAGTTLTLSGLVLAWNLLQRTRVSLWIRQRLAVCSVALILAQTAGHLDGPIAAGDAMVANVFGILILCATAPRLLRRGMQEHREQVLQLRSTLLETQVAVQEQRELLHEVGSTLAGIASASEIIRQGHALPAPRRRRLEWMLEAEVARLVRLTGDSVISSGHAGIDLDEVVGTIVLSHQTRGADVRWNPNGLMASGCADDLAEVLNILLENAAQHAPGAPVTVTVSASDGRVEITCSDLGPGVPAEMRGRLFETGSCGPDSHGQGLGLPIAKRLMADLGGSLELRRHTAAGATFVVTLPEQVMDNEMTDAVAHAS